jgi:PKD repeat protein
LRCDHFGFAHWQTFQANDHFFYGGSGHHKLGRQQHTKLDDNRSDQSSTLSWAAANRPSGATSIAITPGTFTSTSASGSTSMSPTATTTYTLTATNAAGSTTSTLTVTVNAASKPTISSFTASPTTITSGSSSTLSWATTGANQYRHHPGTFTSTSASGSTSVSPTATTTYTLTATNAAGSTTSTAKVTVTASGGPLAITTTSCPGGTQGAAYAGCTIVASGGSPPYTYSVSTNSSFPPLPEGMSLNATTGNISSSLIGGQGTYTPEFVVTDSASDQATQNISIAINGNNAFLANIFPSTSIFHHRVDAATTNLPVDTSPAAPMYSGYLSATVKPFFGNNSNAPFPNGIPAIEVPYNQADVSVTTTVYQSYFTSGPIPANAPVEGTSNSTEIDTFWFTWRQAAETTPPFTRCGREYTKAVPGPIPRTRFGPT